MSFEVEDESKRTKTQWDRLFLLGQGEAAPASIQQVWLLWFELLLRCREITLFLTLPVKWNETNHTATAPGPSLRIKCFASGRVSLLGDTGGFSTDCGA